ncbi:Cullin family-domain-containing protein [Sporodiniella umbellata]|nr:Cullin family-domain-containing protein [Sporodiniella umbellata]
MPPRAITNSLKTNKKRKHEDASQLSIDAMFRKTTPMQIDSPHSLGTFRKQYLVPKISIANLKSERPTELPISFYVESWQTHKLMILAVFSNANGNTNYATGARLCENTCRYGQAETLYKDLKLEIEEQAKKIKNHLLNLQDNSLLRTLNTQWETFCHQMAKIRNIFMELDRYYLITHTPYSSLIHLGMDIFRETVMGSFEFRKGIVNKVLGLIEQDRDGREVDDRLVKDVLYMLKELSFYTSDFEAAFLEQTTVYYQREAQKAITQMNMWDYIHHVFQRQNEEIGERMLRFLNSQTKQPLLNVVSEELVFQKVDTILHQGFTEMMLQKMHKALSVLYCLLESNEKIQQLRNVFGDYIKTYGTELIQNPKNDATMVNSLLKFKSELDTTLHTCFRDDELFAHTLKESFESFINTRNNKPAEMMARFLDSRLKVSFKKSSKAGSEENNLNAIDNTLVLFRYIQGKDAFELYHKRYLAKRLLLDRSMSLDTEREVIEKLKTQCGHEFTKNFEIMLKDIQVSSELNQSFRKQNEYPIYVKVITQAVWPEYSSTALILPPEMTNTQEAFSQFYSTTIKGRKLSWQNSLSSCVLTTHFRRTPKELTVSLVQAIVLLQFNQPNKPVRSVGEIAAATSLDKKELARVIQSLSSKECPVLAKRTRTHSIADSDLYQFNTEFNQPGARIKVPPVLQEQAIEEKKQIESKVTINRQHQLEAAIVRIMKSSKTLPQEDLFSEIVKQLKFPLDIVEFKRKIQSLIERDYIARDPNNKDWTKADNCDEYEVWPFVADDLSARLPLRNLKWQPSSKRAECLIPTLEVDLRRFTPDASPIPLLSNTQTVYLNLYFVTCEDNETYKTRIRKSIKDWLELIQSKKNQEWLIVYVAEADTKRTNNYLGLKSSVFDKVRTDFNPPKQDRCVFIRKKDPEGPQSGLWTTFIEKMKECIISSFDMQVLQIQEDTRRLDMQRHMPGWNYCTFFILKEGLAQAFEIMTLYEDALIQYDELEASFFQVLKDKALAWFGHFGGTDPGDDGGNILDFKRKNYREMITKNMISVFDFRCYLFARQCRMLLRMHRVIDVTLRAQLFITNFIPSIRENEENIPINFVESWVFSACMNVVNECELLSEQVIAQQPQLAVPYNAVKADLLLTARKQLDKIGIKCKHLPMTDPFSIYINYDSTKDVNEEQAGKNITNTKLIEAMQSVEAFDKTYMASIKLARPTRASKSYDASLRSRAALNVHGDIAALKYIRGKYEEAVRIYESIIWKYGEHDWSSIENSLLIKCADSQKRLGKNSQYVESLLALLRNTSYLSTEESGFYTDELISHVGKLDKEIKRPFSPIFSIHVSCVIDNPTVVDTTSVEICIDNHLPKKIHYDTISLRLVGNDPEQITFTIHSTDLVPGKNTFLLTSETSTSGNYVVETCEMKLGKLFFSHNFLNSGQKKRILRLNHDIKQLCSSLSQPNESKVKKKKKKKKKSCKEM